MASPVHLLCSVLMCAYASTVFSTCPISWAVTVIHCLTSHDPLLCSISGQSWTTDGLHHMACHEYWLYWILHQLWAGTVYTTWSVMSYWLYSVLGQSSATVLLEYSIRYKPVTVFQYLTSHEYWLSFSTWPVMSTDCVQHSTSCEQELSTPHGLSCALTVFSTWSISSSNYAHVCVQSWETAVFFFLQVLSTDCVDFSVSLEHWLCSFICQSQALCVFQYSISLELWLYLML